MAPKRLFLLYSETIMKKSLKLLVRFLKTIPNFIPTVMTNISQDLVFENQVFHGDWGLVCGFGANGPEMLFGHNLTTACQIFTQNSSFTFSHIIPHFIQNFMKKRTFLIENLDHQGGWTLVQRFGANGPKIFFGA